MTEHETFKYINKQRVAASKQEWQWSEFQQQLLYIKRTLNCSDAKALKILKEEIHKWPK